MRDAIQELMDAGKIVLVYGEAEIVSIHESGADAAMCIPPYEAECYRVIGDNSPQPEISEWEDTPPF